MPAFNIQLVVSSLMLLAFQFLLLSTCVGGFQNHCASHLTFTASALSLRDSTILFNSKDKDEDDDDDVPSVPLSTPCSQLEEGTFNPFDYQKGTKSNRSASITAPRVDIRSLRMSYITGDLLNSLGDDAEMLTILEDNRDFLLEPLEVPDSLAASGSIYTPDMTRSERYQAYRKSVEDRLKGSNNKKAKTVLTAMKDYVLEFEEQSPM